MMKGANPRGWARQTHAGGNGFHCNAATGGVKTGRLGGLGGAERKKGLRRGSRG